MFEYKEKIQSNPVDGEERNEIACDSSRRLIREAKCRLQWLTGCRNK